MKIIIYLGSRDSIAQDNFSTLVDQRNSLIPSEEVYNTHLTWKDGQLANDKKDLFRNILIEEKMNVRVEFVAHGRDNQPNEFLCLPAGEIPQNKDPYVVHPINLANFFKTVATNDNGDFKFNTITLFCCQSRDYGKKLSELMTNISVSCFHEDIHIDRLSGIALNPSNQPATKHIFKNGIALISENKSDAIDQMINQNFSEFSLSSTAKPVLSRGHSFEKFNIPHYGNSDKKPNINSPELTSDNSKFIDVDKSKQGLDKKEDDCESESPRPKR